MDSFKKAHEKEVTGVTSSEPCDESVLGPVRDSHAHVRTFFAQMYIRGRSVYPIIRLEDVQKQKRCDASRPLAAASDRECLELAHVVPNSKSSMTNVRIHATYTSKRRPQYLDAITGGFLQSDPSCMPSMACFRAS